MGIESKQGIKFGDLTMFQLETRTISKSDKRTVKFLDWFIKEVVGRLKSKRNFICVIHGPTGSGKSYLAMKIAETLSKVLGVPFTVDQILFDPGEFFILVNELPSRAFVVIDEAGSILDARRFMSMINCITSYVLETFRFKQINVIFTVPSLKMVDVNVRRLMHCMVFQTDRGTARIYKINLNYKGGTYAKRIGTFRNVQLPSKELCVAYEKKKKEAFDGLLKTVMEKAGILSPSPQITESGTSEFQWTPKDEEEFQKYLKNMEECK